MAFSWLFLGFAWHLLGMESHSRDLGMNSHSFLLYAFQLLKHKAELNFVNEHGNTPLHYATFWNYPIIAEDLVEWGALVTIENKYGETPLEKCQASLGKKLHGKQGYVNICNRSTMINHHKRLLICRGVVNL